MRLARSACLVLALASSACSKGDTAPATPGAMRALVIPVDGMACERCASRVQRTLTALGGVGDAEVILEQKRVVVHFDPQRLSAEKLAAAIDGAGFKAGTPSEAPR